MNRGMNENNYDLDWTYWLTIGIIVAPIAVGLLAAYLWL